MKDLVLRFTHVTLDIARVEVDGLVELTRELSQRYGGARERML